ncbi:MAG TPA: TIGR03862 family flavoprotein [Steroidobacteraceae bacterium]|nr:TIGR03862 family flavoprotein [Steroidobacteraceae bacterium]
MPRLAVIGGGPAGLMAADVASAAGVAVDLYDSTGSVGRKFLLAGKGGLNLTHSEASDKFVARYRERAPQVGEWVAAFGPSDIQKWARDLGVETFVGTSGRIFPSDMKAAPLLRAWVHRLRSQGVQFHMRHRCVGLAEQRTLSFDTQEGLKTSTADAVVLALGGGSWPQLGSNGLWVDWLRLRNVDIAELLPANCGFDIEWTPVFAQRFAGMPMKSVRVALRPDAKPSDSIAGEFVMTTTGIEGSLIYSLSAELREAIRRDGHAMIYLDLAPDFDNARLQAKLAQPRNGRSLTEHLRRSVGIEGVKAGLIYEAMSKADLNDAGRLAATIKSLPLRLLRPRPLDEAISTAGGVRFEALNKDLMLNSLPGVFCAGEMLDWEAPTGGYLLTACFASGRLAGQGAVDWIAGGG